MLKYDGQKLAKAILPVVDNLERALATEAKDDSAASLKKVCRWFTIIWNAP